MAQRDSTGQTAQWPVAGSADRARAFRRAVRHSARVRFLKIAIGLCGIAGLAGLAGTILLDPFGKLPEGLSIGKSALDGTRITMELPRLSGFRKDGRSYEVRAASGVQDVRTPKVIELNELEAKVGIGDNESASASAPRGIFDSSRDFLRLEGDRMRPNVRIVSTSGYEIVLTRADLDFRAGTVISDNPVNVRLPNGVVAADRFRMTDNGRSVSFEGNVRSRLWQDRAEPGAQGLPAGAPR